MNCKYCGNKVNRRRNKFCNRDCYIKWKRNTKTISAETRKKMNESLKKTWKDNPERFPSGEDHSQSVGSGTKGKFKNINSILDVSKRTVSKIIDRMNVGCSRCGWNEATCDIHHINGRNVDNADAHDNLCILCPNCHREFHCGNYEKEELIPLTEYLPENWKEYYYG